MIAKGIFHLGFLRQRIFSQVDCGGGCICLNTPNTSNSTLHVSELDVM